MAKIIDKIREELLENVLSFDELEEVMSNYRYYLVEEDSEDDECDQNIIKFTNYSGQVWIEGDVDENRNILITKVTPITRLENESTRVEPFRCYEDLEKILNYFKDNG